MFFSARSGLRLVKVRQMAVRGAEGQQTDTTPGQTVEFIDHKFFVPRKGQVMLKGEPCDAAELVEWLRNHRAFEDREEGFWEHKETPPTISAAEIDEITNLAIAHDSKGLEALVRRERQLWNRPEVIERVENAIGQVSEAKRPAEGSDGGSAA